MKLLVPTLAAAALALAACAPEEEMMMSDAAAPYVGKQLVSDDGTVFLFGADGTVGGTIRGEAIMGSYSATAKEICSTYSAPDFLTGREYCSTPVQNGNTVVFNRRDGSSSQPYEIKG
ncbi:hypothetical protein [Primorskyibacter sp. S187A]|uniref:hypothetical protein n=1 Tax=Primorskyibacter sp. S187A TaxID=3415130 RepID=UPI003C7D58DD